MQHPWHSKGCWVHHGALKWSELWSLPASIIYFCRWGGNDQEICWPGLPWCNWLGWVSLIPICPSTFSFLTKYCSELPYLEVQATVSSIDDPLMPVNTFHMWFLGVFFVLLTSGLNKVFSMWCMSVIISSFSWHHMIYIFLDPSIQISSYVVQLVSLPLGWGLAAILPPKQFNTFGYIWSLNPGPFSIKEHVCITMMANLVNTGAPYSNSSIHSTKTMARRNKADHMWALLLHCCGGQFHLVLGSWLPFYGIEHV